MYARDEMSHLQRVTLGPTYLVNGQGVVNNYYCSCCAAGAFPEEEHVPCSLKPSILCRCAAEMISHVKHRPLQYTCSGMKALHDVSSTPFCQGTALHCYESKREASYKQHSHKVRPVR